MSRRLLLGADPAGRRPRGERRERNRKKPDILGSVRLVLVVLLLGECLRVAFASPRLRLREIAVTGRPPLTAEEAARLGGVPLGRNIFAVNLVRVSRNLRRNPRIREAVVTRQLPDTLKIELSERVPALQVLAGGRVFLADREGVLFEEGRAAGPELPRLEIDPAHLPPLGGALPPEQVAAVRECVHLAEREGLALAGISVDGHGELWLNVDAYPASRSGSSPLRVRVGRPTELPEKFRDIRQVLQGWPDLPARAAYLDVMCAGRPAYLQARDPADSR